MSAEFGKNWDPTRESLKGADHAYEIEGQAIVVRSFQLQGKLETFSTTLRSKTKHTERGAEWWQINGGNFYAPDCNNEAIENLSDRIPLKEIRGTIQVNLGTGVRSAPAAALYANDILLYKSPGFNEEVYKKQQETKPQKPAVNFGDMLETSLSTTRSTRSEKRKKRHSKKR